MRATAPDPLLTGASQMIGKRLVVVTSAPASRLSSWQSAAPSRFGNGGPTGDDAALSSLARRREATDSWVASQECCKSDASFGSRG